MADTNKGDITSETQAFRSPSTEEVIRDHYLEVNAIPNFAAIMQDVGKAEQQYLNDVLLHGQNPERAYTAEDALAGAPKYETAREYYRAEFETQTLPAHPLPEYFETTALTDKLLGDAFARAEAEAQKVQQDLQQAFYEGDFSKAASLTLEVMAHMYENGMPEAEAREAGLAVRDRALREAKDAYMEIDGASGFTNVQQFVNSQDEKIAEYFAAEANPAIAFNEAYTQLKEALMDNFHISESRATAMALHEVEQVAEMASHHRLEGLKAELAEETHHHLPDALVEKLAEGKYEREQLPLVAEKFGLDLSDEAELKAAKHLLSVRDNPATQPEALEAISAALEEKRESRFTSGEIAAAAQEYKLDLLDPDAMKVAEHLAGVMREEKYGAVAEKYDLDLTTAEGFSDAKRLAKAEHLAAEPKPELGAIAEKYDLNLANTDDLRTAHTLAAAEHLASEQTPPAPKTHTSDAFDAGWDAVEVPSMAAAAYTPDLKSDVQAALGDDVAARFGLQADDPLTGRLAAGEALRQAVSSHTHEIPEAPEPLVDARHIEIAGKAADISRHLS